MIKFSARIFDASADSTIAAVALFSTSIRCHTPWMMVALLFFIEHFFETLVAQRFAATKIDFSARAVPRMVLWRSNIQFSRCSFVGSLRCYVTALYEVTVYEIVVVDTSKVELAVSFINLFTGYSDIVQSLSSGGMTEHLLEE